MKHHISRFIWITLVVALSSFTVRVGGESYTIHLNNKLVAEHYLTSKAVTPSVALNQAESNDDLSVYYNECGKIGKERKLTIKDDNGKVLKTWSFVNASGEHTPMVCKVKDILALKQKGDNSVRLYYASKGVTSERFLAELVLTNVNTAKK
jgi:hypothetical protein